MFKTVFDIFPIFFGHPIILNFLLSQAVNNTINVDILETLSCFHSPVNYLMNIGAQRGVLSRKTPQIVATEV